MVKSVVVECLSDDCERDETIREYKNVGRCLPSPGYPTPLFIGCTDLLLTMLLQNPVSRVLHSAKKV